MIDFRPAHVSDITLIQQLARCIWSKVYQQMLSQNQLEYMLSIMYSNDILQNEIANGYQWEIIALQNTPIGFLSYHEKNKSLKLSKLYLKPEYHGLGYGQIALQRVIDYAQSNRYPAVFLYVNKQNLSAQKAYTRAGFSNIRSEVNNIGSGYVMDDFVFQLISNGI